MTDAVSRHARNAAPRPVALVVLSDVHLGSRSCRAAELLAYLHGIDPAEIILNGDILDLWAFDGWWPELHQRVMRRIAGFAASGVPVTYIPGNHDAALRTFGACEIMGVRLAADAERTLAGRRTWFTHGDAIEESVGTPRWLALPATAIYDAAMVGQELLNRAREAVGWRRCGFVQRFAAALPVARGHIDRFEQACARAAAERGCDAVVAGHIHCAHLGRDAHGARYLNSGDWVESMTALEFDGVDWGLMQWDDALVPAGIGAPTPVPA